MGLTGGTIYLLLDRPSHSKIFEDSCAFQTIWVIFSGILDVVCQFR